MLLREILKLSQSVGKNRQQAGKKVSVPTANVRAELMSSRGMYGYSNVQKSNRLKQTKAGKFKTIGFKTARTRRINPVQRLRRFN